MPKDIECETITLSEATKSTIGITMNEYKVLYFSNGSRIRVFGRGLKEFTGFARLAPAPEDSGVEYYLGISAYY